MQRADENKEMKKTVSPFEKLPGDILNLTINFLSLTDFVNSRRVSKEYNNHAKFHDEYKKMILGRSILDKSSDISLELRNVVNNSYGLYALGAELISIDSMRGVPIDVLKTIFCKNGLNLLKNKYASMAELSSLNGAQLPMILSDSMLDLLAKKVITFKQAIRMNIAKLQFVLSEPEALIKGLIKLYDLHDLAPLQTKLLVSRNGMFALENKLINPTEVREIPIDKLSAFLQPDNLEKAKERKSHKI